MSDLRRDLLALSCAISAGIHAGLTPEHFEESVAAGAGFATSAVALAALAIAVARRPSPRLVDASIVTLGGLLAAYVLAVTTGVPGLVPEPETIDRFAVATKAIEGLGLAAALGLRGAFSRARRPIPVLLVGLVVAFSALMAVAVSHGHDHASHHHAHAER